MFLIFFELFRSVYLPILGTAFRKFILISEKGKSKHSNSQTKVLILHTLVIQNKENLETKMDDISDDDENRRESYRRLIYTLKYPNRAKIRV